MIGRFLGFATDTASNVLNLFGRSDIQQASVERTAAYFGAVDEAADEVVEPVEQCSRRPSIGGMPVVSNDTIPVGGGVAFSSSVLNTSAASNPPGASDVGPEQVPPLQPAPGLPDPSCTPASASVRAVPGEGSGVDSDIPPSATPERPLVLCPMGGECPRDCDRSSMGCIGIYGPPSEHLEALERNRRMPTTPATPDLNGDPEIELSLLRCEIDAALRRLGRYREMYGPLPE